jgi:outer membrane protein assembly factor BamA
MPLIFTCRAEGSEVVQDVKVSGLHSISSDELLYLLDIQKGEPLDAVRVRTGIKRAFLKGIFDDIAVKTSGGEQTAVAVEVREKAIAGRIVVDGIYDMRDRTILELFGVKKGQRIGCDILDKGVVRLLKELGTLGFPRAVAAAEAERVEGGPEAVIRLTVHTGDPEVVRELSVTGVGQEIRRMMRTAPGMVLDRNRLKRDIERIRAYYKKRHYFNPSVRETFSEGRLTISVDPGDRLEISFDGNSAISDKNLSKALPFFEAEDFGEDIVEEAVQKLLALYHARGYPFAQAVPVLASDKKNVISLRFFIYEGAEVDVGTIAFSGSSIEENRLKEILMLKEGEKYNPELPDSDRESLQEFYQALGYLEAEVREFETSYDPADNEMNISVDIQEGRRTEVAEIRFEGVSSVYTDEMANVIGIKAGDAYNEVDVSGARYRVLEFYGSRGFLRRRLP